MPKNVAPMVVTLGLLTTGGFAAYKWLFKDKDHVSLWTIKEALKFHEDNGFHHPKLSEHLRMAVAKHHAAKNAAKHAVVTA